MPKFTIKMSDFNIAVADDAAVLGSFAGSLLSSGIKSASMVIRTASSDAIVTRTDNVVRCQFDKLPIVENELIIGYLRGPVSLTFLLNKPNNGLLQLDSMETDNALIADLAPHKKLSQIDPVKIKKAMAPMIITTIDDMRKANSSNDTENFEFIKYHHLDFKFATQNDKSEMLKKDMLREVTLNGEPVRIPEKSTDAVTLAEFETELGKRNLTPDDIAHLKEAYTQDPAQLVPAIVKLSLIDFTESSVGILITEPTATNGGGRTTNLQKTADGGILYQCHFDKLPIMDKGDSDNDIQPRIIGYIQGPVDATYKLVKPQKEGEKWAFELVDIRTPNPFIVKALKGEMFTEAEIRKQAGIPASPSASPEAKRPKRARSPFEFFKPKSRSQTPSPVSSNASSPLSSPRSDSDSEISNETSSENSSPTGRPRSNGITRKP